MMEMNKLKLYFRSRTGRYIFIKEIPSTDVAVHEALEDLKTRAPHFVSYYQRTWTDNKNQYWIDVGDWSSFYVAKED